MQCRRFFLFSCLFGTLVLFASRTAAPAAEEPAAQTVAPVTIPLADVAAQAETVLSRLRDLETTLNSDRVVETVTADLPALAREIDVRLPETRKITAQRPSLEMLSRMDMDWRRLREHLSDGSRAVGGRIARLEQELTQLDEMSQTWQRTLQAADETHAPPEILRRIEAIIGAIGNARAELDRRRGQALTVQNRVALQDARVGEALMVIRQGREDVFDRLFVKDSPAVWSPE